MATDSVGLESLQVNGVTQEVVGSCTYQTSGVIRTPKVLQNGTVVYTITRREPYIEVELSDAGQLDVDQLDQQDDLTVIARLVNGKSVVCTKAKTTGENPTNAQEGTVTRRFTGQTCEEVKAS